jgi:hypothetical protein
MRSTEEKQSDAEKNRNPFTQIYANPHPSAPLRASSAPLRAPYTEVPKRKENEPK